MRIIEWIKNLFRRRYIDIEKINFLKEKGLEPFF